MKIELNVSKKMFFLFLFSIVVLFGGIFVFAYNSNPAVPYVFGHSANEIEGVCRTDGTGCPSTIFGERKSFVPITGTSDNGNSLVLTRNLKGTTQSIFNLQTFSGSEYISDNVKEIYLEYDIKTESGYSGGLIYSYLYPDGNWRIFLEYNEKNSIVSQNLKGIISLPVNPDQETISLSIKHDRNVFGNTPPNLESITLKIIGAGY